MARTGVIYGPTGSRKSTACKHFSHYIYEVTGKATLLLSMDGGGWGPMDPEIQAGLISAYRCGNDIPLPVLRKISQGYWPTDVSETDPAKTNFIKVDWSRYGGIIVEGLTSISQAIMRNLADKGIKTGEEATTPFSLPIIVDGQVTRENFAGNSRGHYGFVQNAIYSMVMNFGSLPCHYVLFTALESRTEEDDRSTVYGPQIAGKKATNNAPSWVGDCIHSQDYFHERVVPVKDATGKMVDSIVMETSIRSYFMKHPDPSTGIMFPAKPRVTPECVADLMKAYPGGYYEATPDHGFDTYLHLVDSLSRSQANKIDEWRAKVDAKRAEAAAAVVSRLESTAAGRPSQPRSAAGRAEFASVGQPAAGRQPEAVLPGTTVVSK